MKSLLAWISYGIYAFLLLGLIFHTSEEPTILGRYSPEYAIVLVVAMIAFLPWRRGTRFLLTDSQFVSRSGEMRVFRSRHKALFYSLLIMTVALGAEGFLRWNYRSPSKGYLDRFHPYLQNKLDPNDKKLHVNRHGFRGEEVARDKPKGTFRIFVLGGSTVLSSRVAYEKSHARLLELSLRESGGGREIEILNAGNHWHTTQHSLIKYMFKIRDFEPDLIIVWHGINDLYRSFSPPRLARGEYRADYSHFYGPISRVVLGHEKRSKPLPFLHGESLLLKRIRSLVPLYSDLKKVDTSIDYVEVRDFPSLTPFTRNMRELVRVTESDGVRLVFATQPFLYRNDLSEDEQEKLIFAKNFCVNRQRQAPNLESMATGLGRFNDAVREIADEHGVPLLDLEAKIPKTLEYFVDDVHYTAAGNALVAESIAEFLVTNELLN